MFGPNIVAAQDLQVFHHDSNLGKLELPTDDLLC